MSWNYRKTTKNSRKFRFDKMFDRLGGVCLRQTACQVSYLQQSLHTTCSWLCCGQTGWLHDAHMRATFLSTPCGHSQHRERFDFSLVLVAWAAGNDGGQSDTPQLRIVPWKCKKNYFDKVANEYRPISRNLKIWRLTIQKSIVKYSAIVNRPIDHWTVQRNLIGAWRVATMARSSMCGVTMAYPSSVRKLRRRRVLSDSFQSGLFPSQTISAAIPPTSSMLKKRHIGQRLIFLLEVCIVAKWSMLSTPLLVVL